MTGTTARPDRSGRSGGSSLPWPLRLFGWLFVTVMFATIAWVLLIYPTWQSWQEWTALHSDDALHGQFVAERCESSANRYGVNTTCHGVFTADNGVRQPGVRYPGNVPLREPLPAAWMPGDEQVWLFDDPRYENQVLILAFVVPPIAAWVGWRLLRRRAAAAANR